MKALTFIEKKLLVPPHMYALSVKPWDSIPTAQIEVEGKNTLEEVGKMSKKIYSIRMSGRRERIVDGTLDELKNYFGYTLEIGRSWNEKIRHPKSIKTIEAFVTALQKSYREKEACCYTRTFVELIKEDEFVEAESGI